MSLSKALKAEDGEIRQRMISSVVSPRIEELRADIASIKNTLKRHDRCEIYLGEAHRKILRQRLAMDEIALADGLGLAELLKPVGG